MKVRVRKARASDLEQVLDVYRNAGLETRIASFASDR